MITQAIKRWLHRMFAWWPWKPSSVTANDYAHARSLSQQSGTIAEAPSHPTSEGFAPQAGIPPRRSTLEQWMEPIVPSSPPPSNEQIDLPPFLLPATPAAARPSASTQEEIPPPSPTEQQQLEFLRYLMKRGLVNEGFDEGQTPDQYKN